MNRKCIVFNFFRYKMKFKINVDYYDSYQKKLLCNQYGTFTAKLNGFIGKTIRLSFNEFITYWYFRHLQSHWVNPYFEIQKIFTNHQEFYMYLSYKNELITRNMNACNVNNVPEAFGIGVSLTFLNELNGTTQADWNLIPISRHKDFDFYHAFSNGNCYNVECKGAFVKNNKLKTASISKHKRSIYEKKYDPLFCAKSSMCINIGTIGVCDDTNVPRIYILDPKNDYSPEDYKIEKLIRRLNYYYFISLLVSPTGILGAPFRRAIKDIYENPTEIFNRRVSMAAAGEDFKEFKINQLDVFGNIFFSKYGRVFVGLDSRIFSMVNRNIEALTEYRVEALSVRHEELELDLIMNSAGVVVGIDEYGKCRT